MTNNSAPPLFPPEAVHTAPINWVAVKWWQTLHRDKCIYCHTSLNDQTRTRDHILSTWWLKRNVPFEFRSNFGVMNIAPCCNDCNQRKGNRNAHEWTELKHLPGGNIC
jgi:hypothetical protein